MDASALAAVAAGTWPRSWGARTCVAARRALDGELVAFDASGRPDFHRLGEPMLLRRSNAATFMVFDLLARDGEPVIREPYRERRRQLETLKLDERHVRIVPTFSDGAALFEAMCERGLDCVVAKRERGIYRPGERLWVKTKNRAAPRFAEELAGVSRWR